MGNPFDNPPDYQQKNAPSLRPEDIREFQQLVRQCCGVSLEDGEAWTRATQLVDLLRMLMRPIPEDPEVAGIQAGSSVVSLDEIGQIALR